MRGVKCEMRGCQGSLNFCSNNIESGEECDACAALIVTAAMTPMGAMHLCIKSYVLTTNSYFKSIYIFHFLYMNLWLCPR